MKYQTLNALAIGTLLLCGALGIDCGDPDGGASSTGGNNSGSTSSGDPPVMCLDGQFSCDGQELKFCAGGQFFHFKTCDTTETCNSAIGDCSCELGQKRCSGEGFSQTCVMGVGGANEFATETCQFPATCDNNTGKCTTVPPPCVLGQVMCDSDANTVLHCQLDGSNMPQWVPTVNCKGEGYENGCQFSPGITNPKMLCMNACNVRGVPLSDKLCSPSGVPFCAKNTCNDSGTDLVADHLDCRGGGQPCTRNEECLSCICQLENKLCLGNNYNACGIAKLLCP